MHPLGGLLVFDDELAERPAATRGLWSRQQQRPRDRLTCSRSSGRGMYPGLAMARNLEFKSPRAPDPPAIPAVSDWGVVAMTLLVPTAGTLACMRRRDVG